MVRMSALLAARTSSIRVSTSSSRSPIPTMMPVLVTSPLRLNCASTASDRSYFACGRTAGCMRCTVSMLWERISGRASHTVWMACSSPRKSPTRHSTLIPGHASWTRRMVSAQISAPPSGSSSRLTLVITTCFSFMSARLSATRRGSSVSRTGGRPVLTLQKPHERVHVSPRIMMVAVPRLQHSPMFGQLASWQTVCSRCSSMMPFRRS